MDILSLEKNFSPFRLLIELGSPIHVPNDPVHLDSLLEYVCLSHLCDYEKAKASLPHLLAKKDGVFQASAMGFGITSSMGLVASDISKVKKMSSSVLSSSRVLPTGKNGRYKKIQLLGGPTKNHLNKLRCLYAPYVVFDGVGNGDVITRLFSFYLTNLGKDHGLGLGRIGRIELLVGREQPDYSFYDENGSLARRLPVSVHNKLRPNSLMEEKHCVGRCVPPYYEEGELARIVVPKIDRILKIV